MQEFIQGELFDLDTENPIEMQNIVQPKCEEYDILSGDNIKPRKNLPPLLTKLNEIVPLNLNWIGSSFGLTSQLLKFWQKSGFYPVYLRQTSNDITGEHSLIVIKSTKKDQNNDWVLKYYEDFCDRLLILFSYTFRTFPPSLGLSLVSSRKVDSCKKVDMSRISFYDLKRLESYANGMVDYHLILDLLPEIAMKYFQTRFIQLSAAPSAIIFALGLQRMDVDVLASKLNLPVSQILALLLKIIRKVVKFFKEQTEVEVESTLAVSRESFEVSKWDPTLVSLSEDLDKAGKEATSAFHEKQRELINSLDLDKYSIEAKEQNIQNSLKRPSIISVKSSSVVQSNDTAKELLNHATIKKRKKLKRNK